MRIETIYNEFCRMLEEDKIYRRMDLGYVDICRMLKVAPAELDQILMNELGMTGDEILAKFREPII